MKYRGAVVVLALVAAACGGSDVASVNGEPITSDELTSMRVSYTESDVLSGAQVRDDLVVMIFTEAASTEAAESFGIEFDRSDVDERIENPPERWAALFDGLAAEPDVGDGLISYNARLSLLRDAVVPALLIEEYGDLDAYVAANPADVLQVCASHVLVDSEEAAVAALERIEAGEDFNTVAAELTLAPSPLLTPPDTCPVGLNAQWGPELIEAAATAEIGVPTGPILSQFGYHILLVTDRLDPLADPAFAAEPVAFIDPAVVSDVFTQWLADATRDAEVDIASNIGRWSPAGFAVSPPGT